jgi:hypothetical protein
MKLVIRKSRKAGTWGWRVVNSDGSVLGPHRSGWGDERTWGDALAIGRAAFDVINWSPTPPEIPMRVDSTRVRLCDSPAHVAAGHCPDGRPFGVLYEDDHVTSILREAGYNIGSSSRTLSQVGIG